MKSAEYILLGELNDDAQNLTVSARLVRVSSGEVVSAATTRIALQQAEKAADEFRYSIESQWRAVTRKSDGLNGPSSGSAGYRCFNVTPRLPHRKPSRLGAGISLSRP
ncbi:MAG: FlgO family outer membrane protein [Turneriella sp.]